MVARLLAAAALGALVLPAAASAHSDLTLLRRHAPTLHYAAQERGVATSVEALTARVAGERIALAPRVRPLPDVAYGRAVAARDGRTWLQYWFLYADNPQDRGILRTGRHEGDWELVQVALDRRGRPVASTYAQHAWAEACDGYDRDVFVANASHASYRRPGTHGRPFPDPDDEAPGDGRVVRPEVRAFGRWAAWPGRWGRTEDSWIPAESPSPRGPVFQDPWGDPSGFHARARACGSGAPPHPRPVYAAVAGLLLLVGAAALLKFRGGWSNTWKAVRTSVKHGA
jgi:hypothetical protein